MSKTLLDIHPSMRQYGKFVKTAPVFLLPLIVVGFMRAGFALGMIVVGLAAIGVAVGVLYMRRVHIVLTHNELMRIGIVRRRHWQRADIASVIVASLRVSAVDSRLVDNLFLVDARGQKLLRLMGTHWDKVDLDRLAEALVLPVANPGQPLTGRQFDARYPNMLTLSERRPLHFMMIVMTLSTIVITTLLLVMLAG